MIILGIDISTTVTAYSLINTELPQSNCAILSDGIHLSKFKSLYEKADHIKKIFQEINKEYVIDEIYVEEALQSFRRGLSSARTLSTLARFNGIICYLAQDVFQSPIHLINVIHARSNLGIKLDRKSDISVKDQVLSWVQKQQEFEEVLWPKKTLKSGPRKGQVINDKSCYDIADASVMSLYGFRKIRKT